MADETPQISHETGSGPKRLAPVWRALVESGFIVFLYYSNLFMGGV